MTYDEYNEIIEKLGRIRLAVDAQQPAIVYRKLDALMRELSDRAWGAVLEEYRGKAGEEVREKARPELGLFDS